MNGHPFSLISETKGALVIHASFNTGCGSAGGRWLETALTVMEKKDENFRFSMTNN